LQQTVVNLGFGAPGVPVASQANLQLPNVQYPPPPLTGYYQSSYLPNYIRATPQLASYSPQFWPSAASAYPGPTIQTQAFHQLSQQNAVFPVTREPNLQTLTDHYQRSALRDNQNINSCMPNRQGEPLYLPVNICSHLLGNRSDDEEILRTESGTKLYLSNNSKKLLPEKLTQGLFFAANARILTRLIPNLTPDLACYLDYLRQIGDLLVNYTSVSVYQLDHEHRFEVAELGRPWNTIDPTLSLNWLKKKDVAPSGTSARGSTPAKNHSGSKSQLPCCWQFNQPTGCQFPNCKFPHLCNVPNCRKDHPAFKHVFRNQPATQSATSKQLAIQAAP
jgi:hypothetical protein